MLAIHAALQRSRFTSPTGASIRSNSFHVLQIPTPQSGGTYARIERITDVVGICNPMRKLLVIAVLLMVMGIGIVAWREHMSAQQSPFAVALRVGGGNEQTITEPAPLLLAVFV